MKIKLSLPIFCVFVIFLFSAIACSPKADKISSKSAWKTGRHENFFVKFGLADEAAVKEKVMSSYRQLFDGNEFSERLYYETEEGDGFISGIDSNDVRSEGMSYGMIIAVMMDDKPVFDKLWKFAKTRMQHQTGEKKGYFAWHVSNSAPYKILDPNPAPDGEEYFAMALFFAGYRWGNQDGIYDYESEANLILDEMLNKKSTASTRPLIDPVHKQIVFSPDPPASVFTDPSYHLPAFYELWAMWAKSDNEVWAEVAQVSRDYFQKAAHPVTGLFSEYATFDGKPQKVSFNANSHLAAYDSFRVIQNIAVDYLWFGKDKREVDAVNKLLKFYSQQPTIVAVYTPEGKPMVTYGAEAQVAMNAVGATISREKFAKRFVQDLWNQPTPKGQWRYYNGLLHMLALLHVSGEFKIYGNPQMNAK